MRKEPIIRENDSVLKKIELKAYFINIIRSIQNRIYELRRERVMPGFDLAALYEVQTKALNLAVKRNIKRFPKDFMFRLTLEEWQNMRSQTVTAYQSRRNTNVTPYEFTGQGVAMLSVCLIPIR